MACTPASWGCGSSFPSPSPSREASWPAPSPSLETPSRPTKYRATSPPLLRALTPHCCFSLVRCGQSHVIGVQKTLHCPYILLRTLIPDCSSLLLVALCHASAKPTCPPSVVLIITCKLGHDLLELNDSVMTSALLSCILSLLYMQLASCLLAASRLVHDISVLLMCLRYP